MTWRVSLSLALMATAFMGGWLANGWRLNAEIAEMQKQRETDVAEANAKAVESQKQADALADQLAESLSRSRRTTQKKSVELDKRIAEHEKNNPITCSPNNDWLHDFNDSYF